MFMFFDYYYLLLVVPALLLSLWAQIKVKTTFSKYSKVSARMTGADAARTIMRQEGINVPVEITRGQLTDHFDPRSNVIRLSEPVCNVASVAAVGVAAHETGHALQHAEGYGPMKLRHSIVSVTQFASSAAFWLFAIGLLVAAYSNNFAVAYLGVFCFFIVFFFQLVTLPVEFNASRRAVKALEAQGILSDEELKGVRKVLSAAALTYVAAMLVALGQFLRLLLILGNRRRD